MIAANKETEMRQDRIATTTKEKIREKGRDGKGTNKTLTIKTDLRAGGGGGGGSELGIQICFRFSLDE